ncbi:hypothetical protein FGO68_gene15659 [Halteria grandinella]|uniref:Protein kinase domain-containing protein n=1 Tax=Halteria grandinella TaxID=5974 RepID=A0A8J8NNF6_HALGN|nr:hypothetical protein FGO68_gene15659 [Halteria grandinella]
MYQCLYNPSKDTLCQLVLFIYPFKFFTDSRFYQVLGDSVFKLLKIFKFLDSENVMKLKYVKRGEDFVAFEVSCPETSLDEILQTREFPPKDRKYIAKKIPIGIKDIHLSGYVLSKIKPENILLNKNLIKIEILCLTEPNFIEESAQFEIEGRNFYQPNPSLKIQRGNRMIDYFQFGAICYRLLVAEDYFRISKTSITHPLLLIQFTCDNYKQS